MLRFGRNDTVEVQNYIDDTGVQVADVVVGFKEIEHRSLDDVRQIAETTRFDYYCWDLFIARDGVVRAGRGAAGDSGESASTTSNTVATSRSPR